MTGMSYMIDVSAYQGRRDWSKTGAHAGVAKASEGEHTHDTRLAGHLTDIKAAGLIPGAYHFAWPNQNPAAEAANYVGQVRPHRVRGFLHVLDLERSPNGGANYAGVNAAEIRAYATRWIDGVRAAFPRDKVGVYTSADDLAAGHYPANSDFLWYPAYPDALKNKGPAQAAEHAPPRPSGRVVWGWQYTSTPEDRTIIYRSPAALRAWAMGDPEPIKESEDDMPEPKDLWAYKGLLNGKTDPHDAYSYLRGTNADVQAMARKLDTLNAAVTAQSKALKILADAQSSGTDGAKVAAAIEKLADALASRQDEDAAGGTRDGQ